MTFHNALFEMANLSSKITGMRGQVWISTNTGREKHWARVKYTFENKEAVISFSHDEETKIQHNDQDISLKRLNKVIEWVELNKKVLLEYWVSRGKITTDEVLKKLIPLR